MVIRLLIALFAFQFAVETSFAAKKALPTKVVKEAQLLQKIGESSDLAYQIVESLTTEVGPRLAGSPAEKRARTWALKKLKGFGLKNVRIEPFKVKYWKRGFQEASIESPYPQKLQVTALGGSVGTGKKGLTGQVVRFKTLEDLKSAGKNSLRGKIAFVDEVMTRTQDGSGYGQAVKKRSGAAVEAGKRGAIAALIRSVGTSSHRFPHTGQMNYEKDVPQIPIAALSAPDADQLQRALKKAKKVKVKLALGAESLGEADSGNVIAEIPGQTDEIVVIGAHLDSWDLGTGAIDDGAGVGITSATAKLILDRGKKPKRTIRLVLFGSEEVGLIGAKAYAKKHESQLGKHFVATESDFGAARIWRFDSRFDEKYLYKAEELFEVIRPLGITRGTNRAYGGPDITPLREKGVATITLMQNGWDYFDLHHTSNDTVDKIKKEDMRQNLATWASMVWMLANIDGPLKEEEKVITPK